MGHLSLSSAALLALLGLGLGWATSSPPIMDFDALISAHLRAVQGLLPAQLWSIASWPGSAPVLLGATLALAVSLLQAGRRSAALGALLALAGSYAISVVVKAALLRARPGLGSAIWTDELDPWRLAAWDPLSGSFPSGHALHALVVYGYLATALPPRWRPLGAGAAGLVVIAVGVSRAALGAHWPSDVLGSWLLGAAWLLIVLTARSWLEARAGSDEIHTP